MPNGPRVGSSIRDSQHYGVIIRSQPPGVISRHQRPVVIHGVRHTDGVRYTGGSFLKSSEEGGERGPVGPVTGPRPTNRVAARHALVKAAAMGALGVMHRPHNGHLFAMFGEERQMLTKLDPGGSGRDFAKLAFVVGLRVWFWIKGFLLGESSPEKKHNAGFGFWGGGKGLFGRRLSSHLHPTGESQPGQARA